MMKKLQFYVVTTLLCLSYTLSGQEVEISMDHPDQVKAGEEFMVTVTITKGSLTDYSRFSQDLPYGLTATNVNSPNADFSFDNQRIRIIWLKLPEGNEVKVNYKIMVNERLKGTFILGGVFAYVVEDERKFLNFEKSREITIQPDPDIDPGLIVDIRDFREGIESGPRMTTKETYAMVIRQKPLLLSSGAYLVRLLVKNPEGSKYAKIEETIPNGYLFEKVNSSGGIESFAASTVKFIWMNLPEDPEFEVVYRLVPKRDESQGDMVIEGLFTYTEGDESKLSDVKQMDVALEDLTAEEKKNLLLTGEVPVGTRKISEQVSQQVPPGTPKQVATEEKPVRNEPPPERATPARSETTSRETGASEGTIADTRVIIAASGVYYRVQLIAKRTAFNAASFYKKAGVDREVFVEQHEGLYKYTAGMFQDYRQATEYRDRVERFPDVEGAFVVAYRDGKRIPVSTVNR